MKLVQLKNVLLIASASMLLAGCSANGDITNGSPDNLLNDIAIPKTKSEIDKAIKQTTNSDGSIVVTAPEDKENVVSSYLWTLDGKTYSTTSTLTISNLSAGTYNFKLVMTYKDGSKSAPITKTIVIAGLSALNEIAEDIAGNANGKPATAKQINSIDGVTGAVDGRDYTKALKTGSFKDKTKPVATEIQAVVKKVNDQYDAMTEIAEDIAGNANGKPATAQQINSIDGVTGAVNGRDYSKELSQGTYADPKNPTAAEIQAVISKVNDRYDAMVEVAEDIAGNKNGTPVTATQLNAIVGVTGAVNGRDYSKELSQGTYADPKNPTAAEIQAVINKVNASYDATAEVVEDIAGNANGKKVTATQLNAIIGVTGAITGVDYTTALQAGSFKDKTKPTATEIQAIINKVNAFNEVVEDIAGNANGKKVTDVQLNSLDNVSRATTGTDYTTALISATYVNRAKPTSAEIQAVIDGVNKIDLAKPYGTATQGSTYQSGLSYPATNAIDDNNASFSTTSGNNWWQVDMNSTTRVTGIYMLGRLNGGSARVQNVEVYVSPVPFTGTLDLTKVHHVGTLTSTMTGQYFPVTTEQYGQYVIFVRNPGDLNWIELASVEVYGEVLSDLTSDKIVNTSSTYSTFVASNAIDANLSTLAIHNNGDTSAWIQVYFGGVATVNTIRVLNRPETLYAPRLNNAEICISSKAKDDPTFAWADCSYTGTLTGSTLMQIKSVPNAVGRFIIIKAAAGETNGFGLANIEVNGKLTKDINLATSANGVTTAQGSNYDAGNTYPSANAIDNNVSTFQHTGTGSTSNWLKIVFPGKLDVTGIMVLNRQLETSKAKLNGAKVYISTTDCTTADCTQVLSGATEIGTLTGSISPQYISVNHEGGVASKYYIYIKGANNNTLDSYLHISIFELYGTFTSAP